MKFILSISMAFLLCTLGMSDAAAQTADTTITVKVKGITCANDLKLIQTNVTKLEGVNACEVAKQGATTKFAITYTLGAVKEEQLYSAIEGTGSCENPDDRPYKVKQ